MRSSPAHADFTGSISDSPQITPVGDGTFNFTDTITNYNPAPCSFSLSYVRVYDIERDLGLLTIPSAHFTGCPPSSVSGNMGYGGSPGGNLTDHIAIEVRDASSTSSYNSCNVNTPSSCPTLGSLIVNFPPSISTIVNSTINEGDTYSATGSFTDPDSTSWTATVDYGDGGGAQPLSLNADKTFSLSHQYKDEGTYTVTVSVTDNQGATGTGTATVTVNNATPNIGIITVSNPVVQINNSITASANFTDAGVLDTHTASWNWGDGTTPTSGTVTESNGSGSISDTHTYIAAGVYTVTLTVTDDDGTNPGTQTFQYVSVYNPTSQGLFSAGQHFTSPAGAYSQNTSLTGTVKFGLSYKYQGTLPVGDKQFTMNFNAANLTFNATTISSLVISNNMATLTGTGTINGGTTTYNFLVTGVDGGGIRVQITDPANNNNVIYDTQPGDAATATPTTSVTGHVVVHN